MAHSERTSDDLPKIEPPGKPSPGIAALPVWAQYEIRGLRAENARLRECLRLAEEDNSRLWNALGDTQVQRDEALYRLRNA
jgi:hypothetical protein